MDILSVTEIGDGRSHATDEKGGRSYTRVFRVLTSNPLVGGLAVRLATGIPQRGDAYITGTEYDFSAYAKTVEATQDGDNRQLWQVRVSYDTQPFSNEDPFNRPAEYSWSFAQFSRVAVRDINGFPVTNSAGQFFDPPPEIDDSRPVLGVKRNVPFFDAALAIDYQDAVNSDWFMGFAPGTAKVANITGTSKFENDIFYWEATVEIHFRREGWNLQILDTGRYELKPNQQGQLRYFPCLDETGNPVADPVLLNGQGVRHPNPNPFSAIYSNYHVYKELPFSGILF